MDEKARPPIRRQLLNVLLAIVLAAGLVPAGAFGSMRLAWADAGAAPWEGSGTEDDPYLIEDAAGMAALSRGSHETADAYKGVCFKVTADIDLSGVCSEELGTWVTIGGYAPGSDSRSCFEGSFDGGGHTISGLYVDYTKAYAGLFGFVRDAHIHDLIVEGSVSSSGDTSYMGGIVGCAYDSTLEGLVSRCAVSTDCGRAAGIAGYSDGTLERCSNEGSVTLSNPAPAHGVAGVVNELDGTAADCCNTGAVSCAGAVNYIAGVVGSSSYRSSVSRCWNAGALGAGGAVRFAGNVVGYVGSYDEQRASLSAVFHLEGTALAGAADGSVAKTAGEMRSAEFLALLGDGWRAAEAGEHGGYPVPRMSVAEVHESYEVAAAADLVALAALADVGEDFEGDTVALSGDIDMAGTGFTGIACFKGTFEGGGHCVSGLTRALFGEVSGATVRDVAVSGEVAAGEDGYAAGIAEVAKKGAVIEGCTNRASVTGATAGGICARADGAEISDCMNEGAVTGTSCAGGILGSGAADIAECGNYAEVGAPFAAGIAARLSGSASSPAVAVTRCANKGDVTASADRAQVAAGGIAASYAGSGASCALAIEDCYNTADVSATNAAGHRDSEPYAAGIFAGMVDSASACAAISSCYNAGAVQKSGTFDSTVTRYGQIAPAYEVGGNSYAGFTEDVIDPAVLSTEGCFGAGDAFAAADLGEGWRDDAPGGSPLLAWEPTGATNARERVAAEGLTLSADALSFEEGDAPVALSAAVEPADTTDAVTWSSTDETVATVTSKGKVTPVGSGKCTVTATAGDVSASCEVSVAAFGGTLYAAGSGDAAITEGGAYKLSYGYSGTVTVATSEAVEVKGAGTGRGAALGNVYFDCTGQESALTLRDIYISNAGNKNLADFAGAGSGSTLSIEGTAILDYAESAYAGGGDALVHVPQGCSLTMAGSGTLYLYKSSAGAGIGGDASELNGDIAFAMGDATGRMFAKGTKQGALIGAGADSAGAEGEPGAISFASGTYNLISNSRGAAVGGSAGSGGASAGTAVSISGNASVNVNVDYSGAAVGGGGYAQGNDASGGTLTVTGGSLRTYVDKNAATNVAGAYWKGLALAEGVNNAAVTAERKNASGEDVYLCAIDTTGIEPDEDGNYVVTVDGEAYYTGKPHAWAFVQEATDRALPGGGVAESGISYTPDNWVAGSDPCLYAYLAEGDHVIEVNGVRLAATWDASALGTAAECTGGCFALAEAPAYAEHTVGDVNDSGAISIVDAQIALDMANGLWDAAGDAAGTFGLLLAALADAGTAWDLATLIHAADANADGAVDALDARAIQVRVHTGAFA